MTTTRTNANTPPNELCDTAAHTPAAASKAAAAQSVTRSRSCRRKWLVDGEGGFTRISRRYAALNS
jgi:hypothetical protein